MEPLKERREKILEIVPTIRQEEKQELMSESHRIMCDTVVETKEETKEGTDKVNWQSIASGASQFDKFSNITSTVNT